MGEETNTTSLVTKPSPGQVKINGAVGLILAKGDVVNQVVHSGLTIGAVWCAVVGRTYLAIHIPQRVVETGQEEVKEFMDNYVQHFKEKYVLEIDRVEIHPRGILILEGAIQPN